MLDNRDHPTQTKEAILQELREFGIDLEHIQDDITFILMQMS